MKNTPPSFLLSAILLLALATFLTNTTDAQRVDASRVQRFVSDHCKQLSRLLRPLCSGMSSAPCCTIFDIVDSCSATCQGGGNSNSISNLIQDANTCTQLQVAGRTACASGDSSSPCRALRCLMTLLCLDGTSTCDSPPTPPPPARPVAAAPAAPGALNAPEIMISANTRSQRHLMSRTFEFAEMAACEATNLVPFDKNNLRECPPTTTTKFCSTSHLTYRSIDGKCNNLLNPDWGRSFQPPKRLLPPAYADGLGHPRVHDHAGKFLKSPRHVSRYVSPEVSIHTGHSVVVMAWGQFIDHDFTGFPVIKRDDKAIKCCVRDLEPNMLLENGGPCFPIDIEDDDFFQGKKCMEFVRSSAADDEDGVLLSPREQINGLTSFIDASTVYGSTQEVSDMLRVPGGKLKVSANNMLPPSNKSNCKIVDERTDFCLVAGDHRVNVFVGLQVFHTVFHRLHNQLVDNLRQVNPHWEGETLYQEARKIVAALHQHVNYNEYLPSFLDRRTMDKYRLWVGDYKYDQNVRPDMSNVFSTAAFRFGHSQVQSTVKVGQDKFKMEDTLLRPHLTLTRFDEVVAGLAEDSSEDVDNFFVEGITDKMFQKNAAKRDGLDLVALNVQRGRDHGLPSYNEFRKFCGLDPVTTFDPLVFAQATELSHVYKDTDDIDVFVISSRDTDDIDVFIGGVLERHIPGSQVGPLFACLIGQQFHDIKFGDRFFYETRRTREGFTKDQLNEIKGQSLTSITCQTTGVGQLQQNLMFTPHANNPLVDCSTTPRIDLIHWADTP